MVLREMNTTPTFRIYRNGVQQAALEATFSADGWSIPLFRADFLPFTSKIVEHSRYLLLRGQQFVKTGQDMDQNNEKTTFGPSLNI
jgi:hypothetical protein